MYDEDQEGSRSRPQAFVPRSNEHSNSRGRFNESSLEPGEVRSQQQPFRQSRTQNPQGGGQPNPFYLEYLKKKNKDSALSRSPIAQRYLGASPNSSQNRYKPQNFQRPGGNSQPFRGNQGGNFGGGFKYSSQNPNRY
mmetsp:Transcript_60166/g.69724  ORF Transcript_60166/g.69724 Transcript_60166/m.69724 type:complete len:137 (+) Transcript_60166:1-411(+)